MSFNSFGKIFRFTTWGESHGKAIGCVVDGCPSMLSLTEADIQPYLDKRKPGQSKFTTQRGEDDIAEILSGTFEGKTTGTPISIIIWNQDQRSHDYGDVKDKFRPGHADYTYQQKYGIRDYRGGGRSSARETAMRVAAGAVAQKVITNMSDIDVAGYLTQIGTIKADANHIDFNEINNNPFFAADKNIVPKWEEYLLDIRKSGSSAGAVVELVAKNVPVGLGEPLYHKLDAKIAEAMMSINAVKAVEIGAGFESALLRGEQNADEMQLDQNGKIIFASNNNGGIAGGISTGQNIVVRIYIKPTSSILIPKGTIDKNGNNTSIITKGRHDPCVGIRAVPVCEAMLRCVLADMLLLKRG